MKIYVINLPQSRERRENILRECARFDLEPEMVPGVDGGSLTREQIRNLVFEPEANPLGPSEIGCTLSHLEIYRRMREGNIPFALVLEDDSVFSLDPRPLLAGFARKSANRPEVYLLTRRNNIHIGAKRPENIGGMSFYRGWNGFGGNGYVVTGEGAKNILRFQTPLKVMCDDWKQFALHGAIQFFVCEREIVGLRKELAQASLLARDRINNDGRARRRFFRRVRKMAPLPLRAKYLFRKLWHWRNLRRQPNWEWAADA
ncbi:MAG: glycosyltransferase family 25 protein [Planctomycetota bacterium]|jgi:glycosyl transferase family 25|nr:glycosyltransferase family 25 protein [Planctomycetota bacterium]